MVRVGGRLVGRCKAPVVIVEVTAGGGGEVFGKRGPAQYVRADRQVVACHAEALLDHLRRQQRAGVDRNEYRPVRMGAGYLLRPDRDGQLALRIGAHVVEATLSAQGGNVRRGLRRGRQVHDAAVLREDRQQVLGQDPRGQRIDDKAQVETRLRAGLRRLQHAGVVYQHVETLMPRADLLRQGSYLIEIGKVSAVGFRAAANLLSGGFQFLIAAPVKQNSMPVGCEGLGRQKADAVRGSGDQDRLSHMGLLSRGSLAGCHPPTVSWCLRSWPR